MAAATGALLARRKISRWSAEDHRHRRHGERGCPDHPVRHRNSSRSAATTRSSLSRPLSRSSGSCPGAPCWSQPWTSFSALTRVPACRSSHRIRRRGWTGRTDNGGDRGGRLLSVSRARVYRWIMLKRKIELPPERLYPADERRIVETRYSDEFVGLTETVFSLGNGFVGVRGSFEEGRPALVPGTFVKRFPRDLADHARRSGACARQDRLDERERARHDDPQALRPRRRPYRLGRRRMVIARLRVRRRPGLRRPSVLHAPATARLEPARLLAPVLRTADPVRLAHDEESYLIEEGDPLGGVIRGEPHLLAPGPRSRSSCRHYDRDAARKSSVSSACAPAPPRRALRARRAWS